MPIDGAPTAGIRTLDDVRAAIPRGSTLQNLLLLSNERLESCGRLAIYAYEAQREGLDDAVELFERLAATCRCDADELLSALQRQLAGIPQRTPIHDTTASTPAA